MGDFMERHPVYFIFRQIQYLSQMPGNGFSLTIRVGCQIHFVTMGSELLKLLDGFFLVLGNLISRLEVILNVNPESVFSADCQVADMSFAGNYFISVSQIFLNGLRFGRRLYYHEIFHMLCYLKILPVYTTLPQFSASLLSFAAFVRSFRESSFTKRFAPSEIRRLHPSPSSAPYG